MTTVNKFIAALVGAVASPVARGLVPDSVGKWVAVAIGFLTAAGVYAVPNAQPARPSLSERLGDIVSANPQTAVAGLHALTKLGTAGVKTAEAIAPPADTAPPAKPAKAIKKAAPAKKAAKKKDAGQIGLVELLLIVLVVLVVLIAVGYFPR